MFQSNLEKLGVDMNSSEMQVFRAVLFAAGGTEKPVKYDDVAACLESIADKKYTKAYIYRRLNDLEESGFITVDTIHTPRMYTITETNVAKALEVKRQDKLSESLTKRQDITTRLNHLKSVTEQELALLLYNQLAGDFSDKGSFMIEGVENVRSTIIREFADGAKEGDLVRVLGHASTLADGLGPGGVTELRVMQAGFRGVKVRGLLTPVTKDKLDLNLIAGHLTPLADVFEQASKTGNIQLRLSREPVNTYRIVSLNEDKMLLYLTHAKASDVAALVHRKDNPGLLDDALRTFDELWETSINVLEIVSNLAQKDYVD
jgi:DNA-binding PadR family transcriptional regulator